MKDIFYSNKTGSTSGVAFVPEPGRKGVVCVIRAGGKTLSGDYWISNVAATGEVNYQIDLSMSDSMYLTIFGDKVTTLSFSGIATNLACDSGGSHGSDIASLYKQHKASKSGSPSIISISYGSNFVFKGIMIGMSLQPYKVSEGVNAFVFTLKIVGKPI